MEEMMNCEMSWINAQYLKSSVDTLRRLCRTLMYTYVFAYYLRKNCHQDIFESNQADLQTATEKLSGFLEGRIGKKEDVDAMKRNILDNISYCEQRRLILVQHVYEGYEKEFWQFTV